jgi:hypothetical protein
MSKIVTTKLGRFRAVTDGQNSWWLWECARCKQEWLPLTTQQMDGSVSVLHDHHYGDSPHGGNYYCGYHETHEFGKELVATIQTRAFFGEALYEEDQQAAA